MNTYHPRTNSRALAHGRAAWVLSPARTVAPRKAPIPPGMAMRASTFLSTLPNFACEKPLTAEVPISARCTEAEARAGVSPMAMSRVDEVRP